MQCGPLISLVESIKYNGPGRNISVPVFRRLEREIYILLLQLLIKNLFLKPLIFYRKLVNHVVTVNREQLLDCVACVVISI